MGSSSRSQSPICNSSGNGTALNPCVTSVTSVGNPLGSNTPLLFDPWLTPSLLGLRLPGLPGFQLHTVYPSYLTPANLSAGSMSIDGSSKVKSSPLNLSLDSDDHTGEEHQDPRSSSIASLRHKAKEHLQVINKGQVTWKSSVLVCHTKHYLSKFKIIRKVVCHILCWVWCRSGQLNLTFTASTFGNNLIIMKSYTAWIWESVSTT